MNLLPHLTSEARFSTPPTQLCMPMIPSRKWATGSCFATLTLGAKVSSHHAMQS